MLRHGGSKSCVKGDVQLARSEIVVYISPARLGAGFGSALSDRLLTESLHIHIYKKITKVFEYPLT